MRLRPSQFRYTEAHRAHSPSLGDHLYYNYIAQEFQEIFPNDVEAIPQPGGSDLLQIDTSNVEPHIVKAVQELNVVVKEQQQQIDELQALVEQLVGTRMPNEEDGE